MADNNNVNQHRFDMTGVVYETTRGFKEDPTQRQHVSSVYAQRYPDRNHSPPKPLMRLHTDMLAYGGWEPALILRHSNKNEQLHQSIVQDSRSVN